MNKIYTTAAELSAALRAAALAAPSAISEVRAHAPDMHKVFKYTVNGSRSSMKVRNTRERLEQMADIVTKSQNLYGGGIKRTPKARSASAWGAAAVRAAKVVRELLEDGQYLEALDLAESACGARFALESDGQPMLHLMPQDCATIEGMQSMQREDGRWLIVEPASGRALHNTAAYARGKTYRCMRSRNSADEYARATMEHGAERVAQAVASLKTEPLDQQALRAEWLARAGVVEAPALPAQQADNIDTHESSDTDCTAQPKTLGTPSAADSVADMVAQAVAAVAIEQASEAAALQEVGSVEAMAAACALVAQAKQEAPALAMADAGGSTGAVPGAGHAAGYYDRTGVGMMRAWSKGGRSGQAITSKSGHWNARFRTLEDGSPVMEFSTKADDWNIHIFEDGRSRMAALQKMARAADAAASNITQQPAEQPAECGGTGDNAPTATDYTDTPETLGADYTQGRETSEEFRKMGPLAMDLWAVVAAGMPVTTLVGAGVHYTGNMANPPGNGAIVSAELCKWVGVRVVVQLEDGRSMTGGASLFGDKPGDCYRLDGKMHGAPYLAQLAGAVAARIAAKTSAEELAKQAYAADLERLAAEFPLLKRADKSNEGGKLAAVNIRTILKGAFGRVKFSVTSDYNCVRVRWTDGPSVEHVEAVIGAFKIGAADYNTDYFYTVKTAFSELFGGVQYLNTSRELSDVTISAALMELYGSDGPSVEDYRKGCAWNELANHGSKGYGPDSYGSRWEWLAQVRRAAQGISHA